MCGTGVGAYEMVETEGKTPTLVPEGIWTELKEFMEILFGGQEGVAPW